MKDQLKPCPFCGGEVHIIVCDDEGNDRSNTPEYEENPWSGLGFMLYHCEDNNPKCPIAHDRGEHCGVWTYDTREEAMEAWNRRAE